MLQSSREEKMERWMKERAKGVWGACEMGAPYHVCSVSSPIFSRLRSIIIHIHLHPESCLLPHNITLQAAPAAAATMHQ